MKNLFIFMFLFILIFSAFSETAVDYFNKGYSYDKIGKYDKAIEYYTKAISLDPNYSHAYGNRGFAYYNIGEYDKAIKDCTKAINLDPKNTYAYNNRGIAYMEIGEYDKAIKDYTKAISLDPNFAYPYSNRGIAYVKIGEYDKAIKDYTKDMSLEPNYASVYKGRGLAYYYIGEYDKAIKDCTKAISLEPNYAYSYYLLIYTSSKISNNEYNNAINKLKENLNNFNSESWEYNIAKYFLDEMSINDLLEIAGDDKNKLCEAYGYIGIKYLAKNDKTNAKKYFQKCIDTGVSNFTEYDIAEEELKKL